MYFDDKQEALSMFKQVCRMYSSVEKNVVSFADFLDKEVPDRLHNVPYYVYPEFMVDAYSNSSVYHLDMYGEAADCKRMDMIALHCILCRTLQHDAQLVWIEKGNTLHENYRNIDRNGIVEETRWDAFREASGELAENMKSAGRSVVRTIKALIAGLRGKVGETDDAVNKAIGKRIQYAESTPRAVEQSTGRVEQVSGTSSVTPVAQTNLEKQDTLTMQDVEPIMETQSTESQASGTFVKPTSSIPVGELKKSETLEQSEPLPSTIASESVTKPTTVGEVSKQTVTKVSRPIGVPIMNLNGVQIQQQVDSVSGDDKSFADSDLADESGPLTQMNLGVVHSKPAQVDKTEKRNADDSESSRGSIASMSLE